MRAAIGLLAAVALAAPASAAEKWRPIFNGRDLTGWKKEWLYQNCTVLLSETEVH